MAQGTAVESSLPGDEPLIDPVDDDLIADGGDAAVEARARDMGWKPLAEYRGPPGKWQPAADFVARGETILPIVRDQNRRLTEDMTKLRGEVGGLRNTVEEQLTVIRELRDMGARANQAGYDRAMKDIETKKRQAVDAGDGAAYDQLVEQAEALQSARPAAVTEPAAKPADPVPARPVVSAAVQAFHAQNPWLYADQFLTRKMIDAHLDIIAEGEIMDESSQLDEAKRRLVEAYPDRFGSAPAAPFRPVAPRPARRAAVAQPTPSAAAPSRAAAATINSITDPAERTQARDAFNRIKRQMPDYTEAEYMALYDDPHGDVLTLQQKPRSQPNGR